MCLNKVSLTALRLVVVRLHSESEIYLKTVQKGLRCHATLRGDSETVVDEAHVRMHNV